MSFLLRGAIRIYQVTISPLLGPSCRYQPTCSGYALLALERHGALRGTWFAARRLLRCRPGSAGGYDPVPPAARTAPGPLPAGSERRGAPRSSAGR